MADPVFCPSCRSRIARQAVCPICGAAVPLDDRRRAHPADAADPRRRHAGDPRRGGPA